MHEVVKRKICTPQAPVLKMTRNVDIHESLAEWICPKCEGKVTWDYVSLRTSCPGCGQELDWKDAAIW